MDPEKATLWASAIAGALAVILPAVVKAGHALGYELPYLTRLVDWIAHRPLVAVRRAKQAK